MSSFLSLERQVPFYGAYHSNKTNISIHMIFVPLILFTVFVWLSNTGPLLASSSPYWPAFLPESNGATLVALGAIPGYVFMQPVAGSLVAPVLLGMATLARHLTTTYGKPANVYGTVVHIASWIMQFVGHGVYEGRKPALLDNIFQALYLAPFFVFLEVLFSVGWNKPLEHKLAKLTTLKQREIAAEDKKKREATK